MVKKKAPDSVDDWLREGELTASSRQPNLETTPESTAALPLPIAEDTHLQVAEDNVAMASAEVGVTLEEAAIWFWDLLVPAGFEML